MKFSIFKIILSVLLFSFVPVIASYSQAPPTFSKAFDVSTIGPGSVSTLTFTIINPNASTGISALAFTDNLPAGVTIATPANSSSSCGTGTLSAADGGSTITFSGGTLNSLSTCIITVDVTSSTPGAHVNTSGDLTSSAGNSGTATATLTVATNRPGFTKSFSPSTVQLGGRSTLTLTIDNTLNPNNVASLSFTDNLPAGMEIAFPLVLSNTCTGTSPIVPTLTALPGSNLITYQYFGISSFPVLTAGSTCTISVDVEATAFGTHSNVTSDLIDFSSGRSSGKATAKLDVTLPADIYIQKSFSPNQVVPGTTTNLEFTITNFDRNFSASGIAFTDNLNSMFAGITFTGLPISVCGGTLSESPAGVLNFSGGTLPAEGSCTFSLPVNIPGTASSGTYTNTTGVITATIDGSPVIGNTASEDLFIAYTPIFTKTFLTNPIIAGATTTLEFTITNTDPVNAATNISFADDISTMFSGFTITNLPAPGFGGAGSSANFLFDISSNISGIDVTGVSIVAGGSLTFSFDITLPNNISSGTYTNTTSYISSTISSQSILSDPASDDLDILALPRLTKSFTNDPVNAGGTVNLEFTIEYEDLLNGNPATAISFTDALPAGLMLAGSPTVNTCGGTVSGTGTSTLSYSGGSITSGTSCTVTVPLTVPATALPGSYTNTTSPITATVSSLTGTGNPATDNLLIGGLDFTKEFIPDTALPGELITLRFTIGNTTTQTATINSFSDNLQADLTGLAATGPPTVNTCGGSLSGTTFLTYSGGSVSANTTCIIEVPVMVPALAANGTYSNVTSSLSATIGSPVTISPATDLLVVNNNLISLTKTFTNDPVVPGNTVNVEYTLTNLDPSNAISNIAFTDDFDGLLTGLAAVGLPATECGGMVSGTGLLSFTGGSLAAGASCTFSVTVQTPTNAPFGSIFTCPTSGITGDIGGLGVVGDPATDDLQFQLLQFSKAFSGTIAPDGSTTLTFTITNPDPTNSVSGIRFTDDLDAVIPGLVATNLPKNACGISVTGTSIINFNGGSLGPGQSCSFDVTVNVPSGISCGSYLNTTSVISADGFNGPANSNAATANLIIANLIGLTKTFTNDPVVPGSTVNVEYTLTNLDPTNAISNIAFTDDFDGLLTGLARVGAPASACGGTVSGTGLLSFSGGSLAAGASCTFSVTVQTPANAPFGAIFTSPTSGITGDIGGCPLVGNPASDVLQFQLLQFSKAFSGTFAADGSTTLTFTITNPNPTNSVSGISFTDDLNAVIPGLAAANLPKTACGGTVTGTSIINFNGGTLGAGLSCSIDVTVNVPPGTSCGSYLNTTSVISAVGLNGPSNSNAASANIIIAKPGCSNYPWDGN